MWASCHVLCIFVNINILVWHCWCKDSCQRKVNPWHMIMRHSYCNKTPCIIWRKAAEMCDLVLCVQHEWNDFYSGAWLLSLGLVYTWPTFRRFVCGPALKCWWTCNNSRQGWRHIGSSLYHRQPDLILPVLQPEISRWAAHKQWYCQRWPFTGQTTIYWELTCPHCPR
jgi:hypothetical protein